MQNKHLACSRKTIKEISLLIILTSWVTIDLFCQYDYDRYIPVTINSPLFSKECELQIGANINNYGHNYKIAGQLRRKLLLLSVQRNSGSSEFDPLGFKYTYGTKEAHLIQSKPNKMLYCEFGLGYNFKHKTQKINIIAGIGRQFKNPNTRYFVQLDWGNENRLINVGASVRGNYTNVNDKNLVVLENVIQGKLKLRNFRIVNQWGFALALKKKEDYMKPILTLGIEYVIGSSLKAKESPKLPEYADYISPI